MIVECYIAESERIEALSCELIAEQRRVALDECVEALLGDEI